MLGAVALGAAPVGAQERAAADAVTFPPVRREFRGVWVATVDNIDWPSKPGLSAEQQQAELIAILDRVTAMRLNAVVFQIRPACDALYASKYEPWSEFLTGRMGQAPQPYYDPLAFAITEAHRRGLELHAWFNPYRARHPAGKSEISPDHISKKRPELVRQYGSYLWLDPGDKEVQKHSLQVIRDVVRRYDLDGVHIDDYFYPYKEKGSDGKNLDFPDEPSWQRYQKSGGKLARDDWRRQNVDTFIERLYRTIKAEKRWVKFGISPFGIWRPGYPPQIKGFDQYAELYADARKWLVNGWLDYYTPQLYWRVDQLEQSYPVLLSWWLEQNAMGRHMWPGNFTSRIGDGSATSWAAEELPRQVRITRSQPGATGNVHFSMKVFNQNRQGITDLLSSGVYAEPALVPASLWLDDRAPGKPRVRLSGENGPAGQVSWKAARGEKVWLWLVQARAGTGWKTEVLPGWRKDRALSDLGPVDLVAVSAVDRNGNASEPDILMLKTK